jgi:4-aminobutyrate aminotransferase
LKDSSEEILQKLNRRIAAGNRVLYYPMLVKKARGCIITDVNGKEYLDFNASWTVAGLGYSNPSVINAIKEELDFSTGLATGTFPSESTLKFAEELAAMTPGNFSKKVWFGHSGGDACAAAYKLLPLSTKRSRALSFYGGMHGVDLAGIAMGGHPSTAKYAAPSLVSKAPYAYCYRCPFGLEYPSCGVYCASDFLEDQLFKYVGVPEETSFLIVEAMQSDGGDIIPPKEYHEKLKHTCEKFGILYVADEVKIAPSRTGELFGIENYGVIPDAVAMGKSIASGLPAGALIARDNLLDGGYLMSTLVGNAVVAAAGLATINLLKEPSLLCNVSELGDRLKTRLQEMKERHPIIGDVRGKGLLIGIEFVKDQKSKEPASLETAKIVYRAWELGLVTVYVGPDRNVMEITPPLVITAEELDRGAEILEQAIRDVEKGLVPDSAVAAFAGF